MPGQALLSLIVGFSMGWYGPGDMPGQSPKRDLNLDDVLDHTFSENLQEEPGAWAPDGKGYLSTDAPKSGPGRDIVEIDARTGRKTVLVPSKQLLNPTSHEPIEVEKYSFSKDGQKLLVFTKSKRVWRQNTKGDYWALDVRTGRLQRLGGEARSSSLMFAKLSPDGNRAGYVYEDNLYVQDLTSGKVTPLTHDGSATLINGTFDWVYEEELDLRDGWKWSPDGNSIAYWQLDTHEEPIYTLINDTDSLYPTLRQFPYPKAGEKNAVARIGVVAANGGKTTWIGDPATSETGYLARMDWSPNSHTLLIERLNRLQNQNRYTLTDVQSGKERTVFTDTDAAWVDAWGVNDTSPGGVRWIDAGKRFLVLSEKDGWRHLYGIPADGGPEKLLTPGEFDVESIVGSDETHSIAYFIASPDNATQRYLYSAKIETTPKVDRITPIDGLSYSGTNSYSISPDGSVAVHTHSAFQTPGDREVVSLPDHKRIRSLGDGTELSKSLEGLNLGQASLIQLKTDDGREMDASLVLPPHFDSSKKYPLFFQVYGEPAGLTVQDQWSTFEFLFSQLLAEKGYIVASVDNRGTPSLKGREWRKSVYKKIGIVASADQAAAVNQLLQKSYVDASRVGIWGWSGGGSMTLNMLFRYPNLYSLGMSVAPVPDVHLYDSIYQERYMGLPKDNETAYKECSPITFAKQLKGDLLVVHGSGDDNVHYQGTERLVNELVANGRPFQLMVYPNRSHGIYEGDGTTHHLYELLVKYLTTHLPAGPR